MKSHTYFGLFVAVLFAVTPFVSFADTTEFTVSLVPGSKGSEVVKLQEYLINAGLLQSQPTGNYLGMTKSAVMQLQKSLGIEANGFFGPKTRSAVNRQIAQRPAPEASVSTLGVEPVNNSAGAFLASGKKISWNTTNYPANAGVDINLLRKDENGQFVFVSSIAKNTLNSGQKIWVPMSGETADDLYIQVACTDGFQKADSCKTLGAPVKAN